MFSHGYFSMVYLDSHECSFNLVRTPCVSLIIGPDWAGLILDPDWAGLDHIHDRKT